MKRRLFRNFEAPRRAITCLGRDGGIQCLRTAEAKDEPVAFSSGMTRGGLAIRVMRRAFRCTKEVPHEFVVEWPEIDAGTPRAGEPEFGQHEGAS